MPKQPTFEKIYPTLRKPLGLQKKSKFTVTLRERNNLSSLSTNTTPNIDYINSTIIPNSILINNNEKAIPKYFSLPNNIHATDHNNINNSNVQDNLIRNTEDNLQVFDFTINDNISLDDSRSASSTSYSFSNSDDEYTDSYTDDEYTDSYTDVNSTPGHKIYYDVDSELPEYTEDSGPYFSSLTAMWMFI
jgi:hypothetical protein